ncbi:MAG: hypothetical protein Q8S21_03680 [Candidatus Paracaedibacteraceae bacterium]|nr:hypothetical protein [Candidatus Paracaedibacteraceae bacterium]
MLIKILPNLKNDESRLFLRVALPTLPDEWINAYEQGKNVGREYPGCLHKETIIHTSIITGTTKTAVDIQSVDESYEYFQPIHCIGNIKSFRDVYITTNYNSIFVMSDPEIKEMLDRAGYSVVETHAETPDKGIISGSLITPDKLKNTVNWAD